jgi:hypothetical protein
MSQKQQNFPFDVLVGTVKEFRAAKKVKGWPLPPAGQSPFFS